MSEEKREQNAGFSMPITAEATKATEQAKATEPREEQEAPPFVAMLNGTATNKLTNISTRSNPPTVDAVTGDATINSGELKVFIEKYNDIAGGLRTSTHKLLDACTIELTRQNNYRGNNEQINPVVSIPLEHFMQLCGIPLTKPSKDRIRRRVTDDLDTLYRISLEWTEAVGKKQKDFAKMRLCTYAGVLKGNIRITFSKEMAEYLTNAYIMQYPMALLKVDERNPNAYHIGRKLLLHNSIDNNQRKGTANIISVKCLLEVCPDIPTYEQVLATDRATDRHIKVPLEKALDALPFIGWEYCNSRGTPLTKEQAEGTGYTAFSKLYVLYSVKDGIDQTARLEAKAEAKKKRARKK